MPIKKNRLYLESGLNRRGNMSIELSPDAYDMLIAELRQIRELLINTIALEKMEVNEMVKEISESFPVIITLSEYPTCDEFFNAKNTKGKC